MIISDVSIDKYDAAFFDTIFSLAAGRKVWKLHGQMGAGKTTFIKHLCGYLGSDDEVSSPTFGLVNHYLAENNVEIFHFDLYRVETSAELFDIGFDDYLYSNNLCLIEWPEKGIEFYDKNTFEIWIEVVSNKYRNFKLDELE
jgi:tRNA threonylcarbamoyladenosine biosynthesis protein TsaE